MHTHISIVDESNRNIFTVEGAAPSGKLRQVVAGMLNAMKDSMLIFAPHANSFRRLAPTSHAPTRLSRGIDNRTAAVRVIEAGAATRVENRVSGCDSNPYLMLAIILAGALEGLETSASPPEPLTGDHSIRDAESLPLTWEEALARFKQSEFVERAFGAAYKHVFACCKRQEIDEMRNHVTDIEYDAYLWRA